MQVARTAGRTVVDKVGGDKIRSLKSNLKK